MLSTLLILIFFIISFCNFNLFRPPNYPPGPCPLPFIGNLVAVWRKLYSLKYHHKVWQYWARIYGEVVGLKLGSTLVVIVSGRTMIKEVSSREVFDGRPNGFFYTMRSFGKNLGMVFSYGTPWSKTRRVVLKYLRNFGYGTRSMEAMIIEECKALVQLRMSDAGQPVLVNQMFDVSVVNILWRLVAGKRYDLCDARLKNLCDLITRSFKVVDMSGGILNFMPFLRHVIPGYIGYTELKEIHELLYKFLKETIKEHLVNLNTREPKDVIDAFLIEMSEDKEIFSDEELQVVCLDLLQAGLETVSNTAVFMLLYLVRDDAVQRNVRKEIDEVVGITRMPTMADRSRMLYTEAVILESLRLSTVAAVGIPHMALEDTKLGRYDIPKGTFILLSMHDLHNGGHWKNPEVFKPERFLTEEGNLMHDEWLMPFGSGRRKCIGEGLARSELFLFLTYILQKFYLKMAPGEPEPSVEPLDGVTLSAKPFKIVFQPRT